MPEIKLKLQRWEYTYSTLEQFLSNLIENNKQLEFIQTSNLDEIPLNFDWEKDRNQLLIKGDVFKLLTITELLLNFTHPYSLLKPYNRLENELELTGYVGYQKHLSNLSANVHFWLPNSIGYAIE